VGDAILFVGCAIPELAIVAVLVAIVVWLVRALVS
jgi:hypothetical protein